MSEREGKGRIRRKIVNYISQNVLAYTEAKKELLIFLGGEQLPEYSRFQAMKKKLRTEQAAVTHRNVFGTDPKEARMLVAGNVHDLWQNILSSDERTTNFNMHPVHTLALFRAAITRDGKAEHRQKAGKIFDLYLEAARQTITSSGNPETDTANSHRAATKALARHMRPLVRRDWKQNLL